MPEITIIVPCYNHAHYLPMTVNSVLAQTFPGWEAIIVDDGSTDDTREVAAQFADPRIRYLYQQNAGLSAARNAGIRIAQGDYIAFLDADDEWEPGFLQRCLCELAAHTAATGVITLSQFVDENGGVLPQSGGQEISPDRLRQRLIEGGFFPCNAVVLRTAAVRQAGMFDESLTSLEDWDLWLRITAQGDLMLSIPEPLARYRVSAGSMSTNAARMHVNRMAVLIKHFGPPNGDPRSWSTEKRRGLGFAYRAAALDHIAQQDADDGWRYCAQAVEIEPELLERLDTFYELALDDQPRGYRGEAKLVDIAANGASMTRRLNELFAGASPKVQRKQGIAEGYAYLALAMLNDQAGDWATARRYLRRAAGANPRLISLSWARRLAKLYAGKRAVGLLNALRHPGASDHVAPTNTDSSIGVN